MQYLTTRKRTTVTPVEEFYTDWNSPEYTEVVLTPRQQRLARLEEQYNSFNPYDFNNLDI